MKIRKRNRKKKTILFISFILFSFILIVSTYKIVIWFLENKKNDDIVENIKEKVTITESTNGEAIEQDNINDNDPYWKYINYSLIDVDFTSLKKENNQTVGWIQVKGTNINYPFVQAEDNDFYLNHTFNKSYNTAGWVFMDYRNNANTFDQNTIIYAHGRQNKTMFGSLKNILTSNWCNNDENYVVKLSTEKENTLWQVFSIYRIPNTSDYLTINLGDDNSYNSFLDMLIKRSNYDFKTTIAPNDKILTLSTCYNDSEKVVLHAKLIKIEKR